MKRTPLRGLKPHSHQDRRLIIRRMVPLIRKKFGANLVALAAQASYARQEDGPYSDLELVAFVKRYPKSERSHAMAKIHDGMLVELEWMTERDYYARVKEVTEDWHIAGSDSLLPIINRPFIEKVGRYRVRNLRAKCLQQAGRHWFEVQESAGKVLNAIIKGNRTGLPLLAFDMALHMLRLLSCINRTPYVTFSRFIHQARRFRTKPRSFGRLLDIVVTGSYGDLAALKDATLAVFSEFERLLARLGVDPYSNDVDPNRPMKFR